MIALDVLAFDGRFVRAVTAFRMPAIFGRFDLPDRLPADHPRGTQVFALWR
jgi:hypothetical protein